MTEGKNGQIGYLIRDRAPNARTGSTARVVWTVIGVVLLIPVLVIGGFAISLYNAVGGTAHTATDDTVRAARTKAAESARVEVRPAGQKHLARPGPTDAASVHRCVRAGARPGPYLQRHNL